MKNASFLFIVAILASFLLSCPSPTRNPGTSPDSQDTPPPPSDVVVSLQGDIVKVTWSDVQAAGSYRLYRRIGDTDFMELSTALITGASFDDTDYPVDKNLRYAVRSVAGSRFSSMSLPSNYVSVFVQKLQASRLTFADGIRLMWMPIKDPDFETYVIYRYLAVNDITPDKMIEQTTNTYSDLGSDSQEPALMNTPYYYKVTWKSDNIEYGIDAPHVLGVYSNEVDWYEPNDDFRFIEEGDSHIFTNWDNDNWTGTPYTFSFGDGASGVVIDMDWYKVTRQNNSQLDVLVKLPADTPFNTENCHLVLRFFYNGTYSPEQTIRWDVGENDFLFCDFTSEGGDDLYFQIYPLASSAVNVRGKYKVFISDSF